MQHKSEQQTIADMISQVETASGFKPNPPIVARDGGIGTLLFGGMGPYSVEITHPDNTIEYAPGITKSDMPQDALLGIIAHEIGHAANGNTANIRPIAQAEQRREETQADIWAAKHGFGEQLIKALDFAVQNFGDHVADSHPADADRIAAIRQAETSAK